MLPETLPYCGPAPDPADLLWRWNLDPALLAALGVVLLAYGWDASRRDVRRSEVAAFAAAWLLLVLLFVSPLCAWTSSLFSVRTAHHVALAALVAPLAVLARPLAGASAALAARPLPGAGAGVPAFLVHAAVLWAWHVPAAYEAALADGAVYWAMQLSILGTAVLVWRRILLAPREPGPALLALAGTVVQMGLLGALLTFAPAPLYGPHLATTWPWGLSPLEDQQIAGLLMWVPAMIPYLAAGLWLSASLAAGAQPHPARMRP